MTSRSDPISESFFETSVFSFSPSGKGQPGSDVLGSAQWNVRFMRRIHPFQNKRFGEAGAFSSFPSPKLMQSPVIFKATIQAA